MKHTQQLRARFAHGFTLIELMIAVVVIGVLTGIAVANYSSSLSKSRRADAKNALLDLAARQERFYTTNNAYTNAAANLGYAALPVAVTGGSGTTAYNLSITASTATTFTAQATRTGPQANDGCGDYTINERGVQANVNNSMTSAQCW